MGKGSGYLICSLFLDFIFLLGLDSGDGKPVNGSVRLGIFVSSEECVIKMIKNFHGSLFFDYIFC